MGQCLGRTLIIHDVNQCNNPGFRSFVLPLPEFNTNWMLWFLFLDCDPDLRPTITSDLEHLLNRLENLVERLERSLTAKELAIANQTLDSVLETRRRSFDIESAELPPIPEPKPRQPSTNSNSDSFSLRLERIENSLGRLNDSYKRESLSENQTHTDAEGSLENIPTVLEDFQVHEPEPIDTMSVLGYQDIFNGPFSQYLTLSQKIGGDVAQHSEFVRKAFEWVDFFAFWLILCLREGERYHWISLVL